MLVTFLVQSNALDACSVGGVVAAHIAHSITEVIECFLSDNNFNKPGHGSTSYCLPFELLLYDLMFGRCRHENREVEKLGTFFVWTEGHRGGIVPQWLRAHVVETDGETCFSDRRNLKF